jgi:hypothetical protein
MKTKPPERREGYSELNDKLTKVLVCQARNETKLEYIKEGMDEIKEEHTKQWEVINENKTGLAVLKKAVAIFSSIISIVFMGALGFLKHIWPK